MDLENDTTEATKDLCRILSLDGGGAKGFYTLGILKEIEAMAKKPLCEVFDLIFGTSTGAIIAALISLGHSIDSIHELYVNYVPEIMKVKSAKDKSAALKKLAESVFGESNFNHVKTGVGIVATKWEIERPMIFKGSLAQAHGREGTFEPGFGCTISDAVQASCSAYPFFEKKIVTTSTGDQIALIDGGYCANNPTLYAIAEACAALNKRRKDLRVVSLGVGVYPAPQPSIMMRAAEKLIKLWPLLEKAVPLLQKTMEINTQSMDQLRTILFKDVPTIRISETFHKPEMATDLFEHNTDKLNLLRQRGRESFSKHEDDLKKFLL